MLKITLNPSNEIQVDPATLSAFLVSQYAPGDIFYMRFARRLADGSYTGSAYFISDHTNVAADLAAAASTSTEGLRTVRAQFTTSGKMVIRHTTSAILEDLRFDIYRVGGPDPIYTEYGKRGSVSFPEASLRLIWAKRGPWSDPPEVLSLSAPVLETTPSGWDSMRERLLVPFSPYFACGERREQVMDERAKPFAIMLAQEERVVGFHGPWPIVELISLGFAREKPWTIQTTQDTQGQVGGGGVSRNLPTITVTWFSETLVDTKSIIPGPSVPPETFGWQAVSLTSGLPNNAGWVIIKRDVDPLPIITGSRPEVTIDAGGVTRASANLNPRPTLCKVVDYYVYDFTNTLPPND